MRFEQTLGQQSQMAQLFLLQVPGLLAEPSLISKYWISPWKRSPKDGQINRLVAVFMKALLPY
jgi:hypothetical protein